MALDTITREQFELYRTVGQKEEEFREMGRRVKYDVLNVMVSLPFLGLSGSNCFRAIENGSVSSAMTYGLLGAVFSLIGGLGLYGLVNGYNSAKTLDSEINTLKSDPKYKSLLEE